MASRASREFQNNSHLRALCEAFMACSNDADLLIRFFMDLTTPSERSAISKRWACANYLLLEESQQEMRQKKPYRQIADEVGAGVGTVVRAANCLQDGKDGFRDVYQRLQQQKEG